MRLTQIVLMAIVMMPVSRFAVADTQASCASMAEKFANINVKSVNLWLDRYRQAYARCLAKQENTDETQPAASERNESLPQLLGNKISVKSANPKAVFRNSTVKQVVKPIQKPLYISKIENPPSVSTRKLKNLIRSKKTIETKAVLPKKPSPVSLPTSNGVQKLNPVKSIGAEGWRVNCSPRFGGWDKVSDWYVSTTGKRVSCAIRP